jgi:hypothetical protein
MKNIDPKILAFVASMKEMSLKDRIEAAKKGKECKCGKCLNCFIAVVGGSKSAMIRLESQTK